MTAEQNWRISCDGRRDFLKTVATIATFNIAGCNEKDSDQSSEVRESTISIAQLPRDVRTARDKIEIVYRELEDHPLADNNRFQFDVAAFQNEFERRKVLDSAKSAQRLLKASNSQSGVPENVLSNLNTTAIVAELQIKQRVEVFRTIQTGSMYLELVGEQDFEIAPQVMGKARMFLLNVESLGERLDVQLKPIESDLVNGYDYEQIRHSQGILAEVAVWLDPIYRGSQHFARAMRQIYLASLALESDNFRNSSERFSEANTYFIRTQNAFDDAQGLGRTLPRFEQFVKDIRCILPIHIRFTDELKDASNKFEEGEDERARQMVRQTLNRYMVQSKECTRNFSR